MDCSATSLMTSRHRVIALSDAVLACVVGCVAAYNSPYLKLDASVVLTGAAFAAPVFWRGRWSWRFLMTTAVTAYFLRCALFYVVGTDAVRIAAFCDAAVGVVAVAVARGMRLSIGGITRENEPTTTSEQPSRQPGPPAGGRSGQEDVQAEADVATTTREGEEETWSPPQFTLKAVAVFTLACAGLLAVGVTGGFRVAYAVLMAGLLWFLIERCVRLIRR